MGTYLIAELGEDEAKADTVVGLEAANHRALRRARESGRHVIVRSAETGREVARFAPGTPASRPPERPERKITSDALIRLRETNERLQQAVAPLPKRKAKDEE